MSCHQAAHPFDVDETRRALVARGGGYEVVHSSPGLEIGVYVLVAPEPDRQQPHDEDEVYVVLEGSGVLEVEGTATALDGGDGALRRRRAPSTASRRTSSSRCSSSSTARTPAERGAPTARKADKRRTVT